MKLAVIDTGVFVSRLFWRAESHKVQRAWLRNIIQPVLSETIFDEYERIALRVKRQERMSLDPVPFLAELRGAALWVELEPLGKKVCRDPKDDMFIEAALAARALTVIARDQDLSVLQKPFGISIVTPRRWLSQLSRAERRALD